MREPSASVVVVNYQGRGRLGRCLDGLASQDLAGFETIVVDNASPDGSWDEAERPGVTLVRNDRNLGFGAACNRGAALARGEHLIFVNNDSIPEQGCLSALVAAAREHPEAGAVQAIVLDEDGTVNTAGNALHYLGFSWAPLSDQPPDAGDPPYETAAGSGAALLVPRARFEAAGGFWDAMFLYCEDTDLSWRLRLHGWSIVVNPAARSVHEYDFHRTPAKHFFLERNRIMMLLANYETGTLIRLAPALIATEIALVGISARQGWLPSKLRAMAAVATSGSEIRRQRRMVQATRAVRDAEVARLMESRLGPRFGRTATLTGRALTRYARLVGLVEPGR